MQLLPFISLTATLASTAFADKTTFEWSDDCKDGPLIQGGFPAGAIEGTARCETKWPYGIAVSGIKVWHETDKSYIRGIKLYYQNGESSETLGNEEGETKGLEWNSYDDGIKTFTTWNDDKGTAIGHIFIETKRGYTLDVGRDVKGKAGDDQPTGSGIMLGVRGFMGWKVDGLAPLFFKSPIKRVSVGDVQFDTDQQAFQKNINMKAELVRLEEFPNDTGAEMIFTFKGTGIQTSFIDIDRPQAHIGMGLGTSYPISYRVRYPILSDELGLEGGMRATWKYLETSVYSHHNPVEKEVSWDREITIQDGQTIECEAFYWYAEYSSTYISKNIVYFESEHSFTYDQQGVFTARSVSNLGTDCWDKATLAPPKQRRVKRGALGI